MSEIRLKKDFDVYLESANRSFKNKTSTIILTLKEGSVGILSHKSIFECYTFKVSDTLDITVPIPYEDTFEVLKK